MDKIFSDISKQLNEESTLREEIKTVLHEMTATLRSASAQVQQIHGSIKNGKFTRSIQGDRHCDELDASRTIFNNILNIYFQFVWAS